eukprot:6648584-Ditylum_brightwellii.AAC.1
MAETPFGEAFRAGNANIDTLEIDKYMKDFLKELQQKPTDPPPIDITMTAEKVKTNYKNWKESTSTLPEGQYLSMYKTWLKPKEEKEEGHTGIK